jgi:hypothetical protein
MTLQELRDQVNSLAHRSKAEREHLSDALKSMNYTRALASQKALDRLEGELSQASARLFLRPDH